MKKIVRFFQEKVILSLAMCVLLAVVLTTATTAWYAINNSDIMHGLELKTGGTGGIKVAVEEGGPDILSAEADLPRNDRDIPIISINLKDFENIESGKIAPGAYGPMTFYITALTESIHSYRIKVQMEYRPSNVQVTPEQKQAIEAMIKDHFSVYKKKYRGTDAEGKSVVRFSDPLTFYENEDDKVTDARGALKYNEEVMAEIYWVWNYELTDIPGYESMDIYKQSQNAREAVRTYDEQDTMLGNYINDIWFNVYIEGSVEEVRD